MSLAIKELMSGKVVPFDQAEYPVCGGRAVVRRLRDNKISLRCRGQSSIVVTRRSAAGNNVQEIIKSGMTTELLLQDIFFANGTLSKYQVVNATSIGNVAAKPVPTPNQRKEDTVTPVRQEPTRPTTTPPSSATTISSPPVKKFQTIGSPDTIDLADELTSVDGGNCKLLDTSSHTEISVLDDSSSDEENIVPRKRIKTSRNVVVEDEVQSSQGVESVDEDDVYLLKEPEKPVKPFEWLNKYNRENQEKDNGWVTTKRAAKAGTDEWTSRKLQPFQKKAQSGASKRQKPRERQEVLDLSDDDDDEQSDGMDSDDGGRYGKNNTKRSRANDVTGMLQSCEAIASTLRVSISKWGNDSTNDEEVNLVSMNESERMITQKEIPGLSPTLVLQPYQVVGVNWLYLLYQHKVSAVLADEMGLGKTVQTIAFLALVTSQVKSPHLVIVPASVLSNWEREFEKFAPSLRIETYQGSSDDRSVLRDRLRSGQFDVLLTTYSYFERDSNVDDRKFLRSFKYGYLVLDEGHTIKNAKTARFKRISTLKSRNRLVLSGTPIQNNLNELLALLSFIMPGIFNHGSDELMDFFGGEETTSCSKIRRILAPFILRRLKKLVLAQMVPKIEIVETVKMTPHQLVVYNTVIQNTLARKAAKKPVSDDPNAEKQSRELAKLLGKRTTAVSTAKGKNDPNSDSNVFTLLRKAANHPTMLRHYYGSADVMDIVARHLYRNGEFGSECSLEMVKTEIDGYSDFDIHQLCLEYAHIPEMLSLQLPPEKLLDSAKFDFIRDLLPRLQKDNHRVLIFSQWTKVLDMLETLMIHTKHRYTRLDGSTSIESRQSLIDDFNDDPSIFCFLLSTRAGGMGINLTAADTVILHDLDFNPTLDAQAMDRCHRIGQTKPVTVYKLVTAESVDQSIFEIATKKSQLNETVLGNLGKKSRDTQAADIQAILTTVLSSFQPPPPPAATTSD
ncbi:Aste57867_21939 [Aphanomyces stellatus]|uniref:Aste57867_21939 protein n=1 Tax=Aphanomyces stellatus TaxID=120398 RepID=A0A485LJI2_9STRA|nr:hypothetical protein As57867_021870 [Aphanomyces stellatus]VFT98607.1 Aste57867_21939 [Aphanomyces stellatus]